jgi:hypothetical protein
MGIKKFILVAVVLLGVLSAQATTFDQVPNSSDISTLWVPPTRTVNSFPLSSDVVITHIPQRVLSIISSSTPAINTDLVDCVTITALATNITSMTTSLSGAPADFDKLIIRFKDNATPHSIAWGVKFESSQGILPVTTITSKVTTVGLIWNSAKAKWVCLTVDQEP